MLRKFKNFIKKTVLYKPILSVYIFLFDPFGFVHQYVITPFAGFFRKHRIRPFYNDDLQYIDTFRDKYRDSGKRCFIVATGPSLTLDDIDRLYRNGEYTIGVNKIYKLFKDTNWRPDVYAYLDPMGERIIKNDEDFKPGTFGRELSFLNALFLKRGAYENVHLLHVCWQNHWLKAGDINYDHGKNLKYNPDIVWGIFDKYTITNAAIEIAIFLGFREIYLLGVDNNYGGKSHFYESNMDNQIDDKQVQIDYCNMTQSYEFMERETKKHGVHVYNATRGGMLEAFDRVDFDQLFEEERELCRR